MTFRTLLPVAGAFLMVAPALRGDDASDRAELLLGEKFADQYFVSPPLSEKSLEITFDAFETSATLRTGSPLFQLGAKYQFYRQGKKNMLDVIDLETPVTDSEINVFWAAFSDVLKQSGMTIDKFASLTNDPYAKDIVGQPYPPATPPQ
jgi:hypothetical protein